MRKASRQKDEQWALEVLARAPFVTMSMITPDGCEPYAVPISIVIKNAKTFYFHCAAEGEKIDCIKANPRVHLSAVSKCTPKFEEEKQNYTMHYNSAMAVGEAEIVDNPAEKIEALRLLCERFLPRYMEHFDAAIERSLSITTVVRIRLTEPAVGKTKPA